MAPIADRLLQVQSSLTDRDHTLLSWLYDHGVLTTDQIAHALFPSLDFCQRRLLRLTSLGVVARFRPQKPYGGSFPYHYVIDQLGADIVAAQRGEPPPRRDHARARRHHLTSRANLPHLLGINQFFTDLVGYARTEPGAVLERWWPASRLQSSAAFYQRGDDAGVMLAGRGVRPDAHGIWVERSRVAFYLEYDTGTETLGILVDKVGSYTRLALETGRPRPVLFWLPTVARELHLHQRLAEFPAGVDAPVATATRDHAAAVRRSPAEDIWWLHGRTGARCRLAALGSPAQFRPHTRPTYLRDGAYEPRGDR
ncbi:MAG TPA: replication-relaxation family protein [Micromonosporaceae bacterium]|jgi:hypothetical protein